MCLWWWWSWATLFSWPKTDVSNTRLVPYSSFTPPQACVSGGQPEGSGEDLRIKLVIQHCCLWWWDCTGLRVGGLQPDVVLLRSMLRSAAGLAGFIALHTLQFLVSWHWDGNLNSLADWTSSPLKTRPPPRSSPFAPLQPSVTTLSLCGAEWVPFSRVYDPAFADRGSRYVSPSKAFSHTPVTSGQLWAGLPWRTNYKLLTINQELLFFFLTACRNPV